MDIGNLSIITERFIIASVLENQAVSSTRKVRKMREDNDVLEQAYRERQQQLLLALQEAKEKGVSEDAIKTLCFESGISYKELS
jgi:hypothetical protein